MKTTTINERNETACECAMCGAAFDNRRGSYGDQTYCDLELNGLEWSLCEYCAEGRWPMALMVN